MNDFPRPIEYAFPLKQAALHSVHDKNARHCHISTLHIWPARRPLAACGAEPVCGLMANATGSMLAAAGRRPADAKENPQ